MTTPIVQNQHTAADRKPLPPVEGDAHGSAAPIPASAIAQPKKTMPAHETKADPNNPPGEIAKSVAHWVHHHPQAHKHGAGIWIYQIIRSAIACIPYGISMALTLAGVTGLERKGKEWADAKTASRVTKGFGSGLNRFAKFPATRPAALVATSFTFYRGTSKLVKWMTEYLFNPKDSEARTTQKVDDLPHEAWRKIKEIAPAEYSSTPIAAIVLGLAMGAFSKPYNYVKDIVQGGKVVGKDQRILEDVSKGLVSANLDWTRDNFKATKGILPKLKLMGSVIAHPNAKFIPQTAIFSMGYALFFEMGDRLYKDAQIRRGVWPGEHNSIKALKAAPDEYEQGIKAGIAASKPKYEDGALEAAPEKKHYSFFTAEPGIGRFIFRRLLPTTVSITAYTASKFRWATMLGNDFSYSAGEKILPKIPKLAGKEGLATTLFFLIPIVSEHWEKWYDKYFAQKEKIAQLKDHIKDNPNLIVARQLTPHQEQKYDALLARVTEKARQEAQASALPLQPKTGVSDVQHEQRVASNDRHYTQIANG